MKGQAEGESRVQRILQSGKQERVRKRDSEKRERRFLEIQDKRRIVLLADTRLICRRGVGP